MQTRYENALNLIKIWMRKVAIAIKSYFVDRNDDGGSWSCENFCKFPAALSKK